MEMPPPSVSAKLSLKLVMRSPSPVNLKNNDEVLLVFCFGFMGFGPFGSLWGSLGTLSEPSGAVQAFVGSLFCVFDQYLTNCVRRGQKNGRVYFSFKGEPRPRGPGDPL